ncbi:MAG: DUF523 domain-containing protein [Thermotogae bacterium]|nr:DUF523 domain-containing protein [Thermotogota bacterium]
MSRPLVVISKCLGFARCRYNGKIIEVGWLEELKSFVELLPVCPEVAIGLGVPRDPISLVLKNGEKRLVQVSTGCDLTEYMRNFSREFLSSLSKVSGFILKSKSPSCGVYDTPVFADLSTGIPVSYGSGLFTQMVFEFFPSLPIVDEKYLTLPENRYEFLKKISCGRI